MGENRWLANFNWNAQRSEGDRMKMALVIPRCVMCQCERSFLGFSFSFFLWTLASFLKRLYLSEKCEKQTCVAVHQLPTLSFCVCMFLFTLHHVHTVCVFHRWELGAAKTTRYLNLKILLLTDCFLRKHHTQTVALVIAFLWIELKHSLLRWDCNLNVHAIVTEC